MMTEQILLTLMYRGTAYAGFQVQPGQKTVQNTIQNAMEQIYHRRLAVVGCSRTDAGVHARDYKLTYRTDEACPTIPLRAIPAALNTALPPDIVVLDAQTVPDSFHVRHDVYEKEYEYRIWNAPQRNPFEQDTAYHYRYPLSETALHTAAQAFLGTHDFRSFMASGSAIADTIRTIRSVSVSRDGCMVIIRISADGFLYNMVRIIVGTLLSVAEGKIASEQIPEIISSCDRSRAGMTVPACGLYLNRVQFNNRSSDCVFGKLRD